MHAKEQGKMVYERNSWKKTDSERTKYIFFVLLTVLPTLATLVKDVSI